VPDSLHSEVPANVGVSCVWNVCSDDSSAVLLLRNYNRMPTANSFRSCTHHRRPQPPPLLGLQQ